MLSASSNISKEQVMLSYRICTLLSLITEAHVEEGWWLQQLNRVTSDPACLGFSWLSVLGHEMLETAPDVIASLHDAQRQKQERLSPGICLKTFLKVPPGNFDLYLLGQNCVMCLFLTRSLVRRMELPWGLEESGFSPRGRRVTHMIILYLNKLRVMLARK